jgi:hypothetical protein
MHELGADGWCNVRPYLDGPVLVVVFANALLHALSPAFGAFGVNAKRSATTSPPDGWTNV